MESEMPTSSVKSLKLGGRFTSSRLNGNLLRVPRDNPSLSSPCQFKILNKIGKGGYGDVFTVEKIGGGCSKDEHSIYAMKAVNKGRLAKKPKDFEYAQCERYIMATLRNPFLVSLNYAFQTESKLYYIMDYVPGGEIFSRLSQEQRLDEDAARFYLAEIILGLEHLHDNDIIYRDLKPDNILIDREGHIKLADFGLCKVLKQTSQCILRGDCCLTKEIDDQSLPFLEQNILPPYHSPGPISTRKSSARNIAIMSQKQTMGPTTPPPSPCVFQCSLQSMSSSTNLPSACSNAECDNRPTTTRSCCGTLVYMAPEVVSKCPYGMAADFWSLGVLTYDMLVGNPPFLVTKHGKKDPVTGKKRKCTDRTATRYNILHCNYCLPDMVSEEAKLFVDGLLQLNVEKRMGGFEANITDLKVHPFLENINWDDVMNRRIEPSYVPLLSGPSDVSHFDSKHTSDMTDVGCVIQPDLKCHQPSNGGDGVLSMSCGPKHLHNFEYVSPGLEV